MTVRLRGHHLLCLLTFSGHGYTPGFTRNMERIARRLAAGEEAEMVEGPDDICVALVDELGPGDAHCTLCHVGERDRKAIAAVSERVGHPLAPPGRITFDHDTLTRLRAAFAGGAIRAACEDCEWSAFCTAIAANGFAGTRLSAPRKAAAARSAALSPAAVSAAGMAVRKPKEE